MSDRTSRRAIFLALSSLLAAPAAMATEDVLEEVVVTASYRATDLRQTIGSITVVDDVTMRERAALHLQDILNTAPNVTFSSGSSRSRFIQVRGVGDLEQYYDPKYYPSVGMMLDLSLIHI